jgi:hypothetical protein
MTSRPASSATLLTGGRPASCQLMVAAGFDPQEIHLQGRSFRRTTIDGLASMERAPYLLSLSFSFVLLLSF